MKLAVLSDIHGNMPALSVVAAHVQAWQPDAVVVNGDVVNRGPNSLACLRFIQDRQADSGWQVLRGNHEDYVSQFARPGVSRAGRAFEINRLSYWTYEQLDGGAAALDAWPDGMSLPGPGGEIRFRHASMRGNRDGLFDHLADAEVRERIAPLPALFCTAHIHWPGIRRIDDTLLVNSGSVGSPCDGDTRASYAQLIWTGGEWQAEIVRLEYDRSATERDFAAFGFLEQSGPVSQLIYYEWKTARYMFAPWAHQYQARVLAGELDLDRSVARFLEQAGV